MNKYPVIVQLLIGFIFVMLVGVVIIATSGKSEQEKTSQVLLRAGTQLTKYATKQCSDEMKKTIGVGVHSPTKSEGDRLNYSKLTYNGNGKEFTTVECTYEKGKGVISLLIDGVEKIK